MYGIKFICIYDVSWYPFDIQTCTMDLKSPGTRGSYVDLVKDKLNFTGSEEMSSYFLRDIEFVQKESDEWDFYNKGTYVQCIITLGRRLLSIMVNDIMLSSVLILYNFRQLSTCQLCF